MRIRLLPAALDDLVKGIAFYDEQCPGLGDQFFFSVSEDINSLGVYAGIHPLYLSSLHRLLCKRFPFAVYYRVRDDQVVICAVLDCRQDPRTTHAMLKRPK